MSKWFASICMLPLVLSTSAFANDTMAELGTGGLIFTRSDEIEMQYEKLFISTKEIRVQYRFYNHSNKDIVTQVAFPMPDIPYGERDVDFAIPTTDRPNILGFTTTVNGHPVAANVQQRAMVISVDRTDVLHKLGIPVAPPFDANLDHLPPQTLDQLANLGLVYIEKLNRNERHIYPRWTLKTTYYWQQTFPAHETILIDHRYIPSVGGVVAMSASDLIGHPLNLGIDPANGLNRYCVDQKFIAAIETPPKRRWEQKSLKYILATGANWSGPIKSFQLVVDKGSPKNLLSFCGQGSRKISPTQFEMNASQFIPTTNLDVLFLVPDRSGLDDHNQGTTGMVQAQSNLSKLSCDKLWYQRNSIFKAARYCFHTPRALRVFGNAGCKYDNQHDLSLSDSDRRVVSMIQQAERMKHCFR